MPGPDLPPQLPPGLRFLKALVIVLMITMIVGVITVVGLLVTRMPDANAFPDFPASLAMPAGAVPEAITHGPGWTGVVTTDGRFLIFGPDGSLRQEITVAP